MPTMYEFEPVPEWLVDEVYLAVQQELLALCIPEHLDGFSYLCSAIVKAVRNPECARRVAKVLYLELAREANTSPSCVERSMRTAIAAGWQRGGQHALEERLNCPLSRRPTNSQFIRLVTNAIRHSS